MTSTATFGTEFIEALLALQQEAAPIKPNALNGFTNKKYVALIDLHHQTKELVAKHGFAVSQPPTNIDGKSALKTLVMHKSGQYLEEVMPIELPSTREEEKYDKDLKKAVTRVTEASSQDQGSAISHLRRYAYMSALGLVSDSETPYVDPNSGKGALGLKQPTQASTKNPPSAAQINMIKRLAGERNIPDDQVENRLAEITNAAQASEAITNLKAIPVGGE